MRLRCLPKIPPEASHGANPRPLHHPRADAPRADPAREALFTAYLNDWAGYNGLLCAVRQAAQAETNQTPDPERAAQLRAMLGAEDEGPFADLFDFSLDKLALNMGIVRQELSGQLFGLGDPLLDRVEAGEMQDLNPMAEFVVDALAGDWAGKEILRRYLANGGDWSIVDDPAWTASMRDSVFLRVGVHDELTRIVAGLIPMVDGETRAFNETSHMEIENGESAVGNQVLHGTNPKVGDFAIAGQAFASPDEEGQRIEATVRYTWNDVIDPNPRYGSDLAKSLFAEILTLGGARPYTLAISWSSTCTLKFIPGGEFIVILDGWPGLAS